MLGWNLAAYSEPASIVGGDYFDFLKFGDGANAVVIADVMGKGMPASMLMASLQASLRIIFPASTSPEQLLNRTNQIFCHNINLIKFVTIVVAHLDSHTGVIRYANARHSPPLLINARQQGAADVVALRPTGAAIGLVEGATFAGQTVSTRPGDLLVFYTDGVIEAMNAAGEDFGEERMRRFLLGTVNEPSAEIIKSLRTEIQSFTGTRVLGDDTTIIVMKRSRR